MKKWALRRRLIAGGMALVLLLALLPAIGLTERIFSDWVLPVQPEAVPLTEENAEITVTLRLDGRELSDGDAVPAGALLTAEVSFVLRENAADAYTYRLPDAITPVETDWAPLPGGRWRLTGRAVTVEFEPRETDGAETVGGAFTFSFFPDAPGTIPFPGCAVTVTEAAEEETALLTYEGKDVRVTLIPGADAGLPENTALTVEEQADPKAFAEAVADKLSVTEREITFLRVFDLSLWADGREIEPSGPVRVCMEMPAEGERIAVLHITQGAPSPAKQTPLAQAARKTGLEIEVLDAETEAGEIVFDTDGFSLFAVAGITYEQYVLASDGRNYRITVTYHTDARVPEDASLQVREIPAEHDPDAPTAYDGYAAEARRVLGMEEAEEEYLRLFDIALADAEGQKVEIAAPVTVTVSLADGKEDMHSRVVHFPDGGGDAQVVDSVTSFTEDAETVVSFTADGFSVYAIVDAPEPAQPTLRTVANLTELQESLADNAFCLSVTRGGATNLYFKSALNGSGCFTLSSGNIQAAAEWTIESTGDGAYRVGTLSGSTLRYIANPSGNLAGLTEAADEAAVFDIAQAADGLFYFRLRGQNKWLQYSNGGGGIRFYTANDNAGNCQITITYASTMEKDPYGLDSQSFGIAYHNESATSAALTAEGITVSSQQRLAGQKMVMKPDVLDNDGILLVAQDSDIQFWTFEAVREDKYYVTTLVDGVKKYLTISGSSVTLTDAPDGAGSLIQATPGSGARRGKWSFSSGGYSLNLPGTAEQGFNATSGSGDTAWMNLVEQSVLGDDDFQLYTAKKISVSDTVNMYNSQQVVIYTRIWNDEAKKYEFYAVDHDGSLIRCYDAGDSIEWIGSQVNTALWQFTEYYNKDGTVNYYYEFQNTQYGSYIAPQGSSEQILSDHTIGVNLNGRRYGETYSTIIAWDDPNYSYSGLKTENGHIVASALSEAQDFYFAVINPVDEEDRLTTVRTVDSTQYGISMRMMDFNNPISGNRDTGQAAFMGTVTGPGLLSTDLGDDGYPTGTSLAGSQGQGQSLSRLFNEMSDGSRSVNHLFIQSVYNESGYFEYDSTQNFAHLNGDGTFTVYDQIGAITGLDERKVTRVHGQFMPYNSIQSGVYAYDSSGRLITNQTGVLASELSDLDPRKGEKLYSIGTTSTVDYFFGMEMQASFTQTASGLDAWGHDIIFEFSGDDDFWLYVDGELVIDLGGIHQAQVGTINFRTGVITSSNGNSTLYETFKKNYETRGLSEEEIARKLEEIFEQNENGQYVFKDYTNHTMKMYYMERGAGASNLHMRFNLAAVKPGSFIFSKKLSGTDHPDNSLIEFPYQICYYSKTDGGTVLHLLGENEGEKERVLLKDTTTPLRYAASFTPADGTEAYDHVFFLRPGQSAEVNMPEDTLSYYMVECGVNPDVYDHVYMNGEEVEGVPSANPGRNDYTISPDTLDGRPKVDWDNHVSEGAMRTLSITKKLYDVDGATLLHYPDNDSLFTFRLYLGNENTAEDDLPAAFLYPYCIRDAEGNYCRWDAGQQTFVSLGIRDYDALRAYLDTLTGAQQESIVFITSPNGSISKIPADYTVEVRDLIVGTHYKAEERDWEIPKGYTRRESDGYTRVDVDPPVSQQTPIGGTLHVDEDPALEIRNQKGWGLTVEKVWTDKDFMAHDPIYFAVYLDGQMVEGSVRQLPGDETEIYYFFDDLYDSAGESHTFQEFVIREVMIENEQPTVEDGVVLDPGAVTPVGEGGVLAVGGTPAGGSHQTGYHYAAHYEVGESTGHNENVRTDRVTNSRPGIELYKTDWQGNALAGAVFTLKDAAGADVSAETYTSDGTGLITIAYPPEGVYTLTETEAPKGYLVIDSPMTIHVNKDNEVTVTDIDERFYRIEESQTGMLISIIVKDRTTALTVLKTDAKTGETLAGVHFALYRQVTDNQGNKRKDYLPMEGYEDLVTDDDGVLAEITMDLQAGTYYLEETATLPDYVLPADDLCFTIGADGTVTVETEAYQGWLSWSETEDGAAVYTLNIPNSEIVPDPVSVTVRGSKILEGRDMRQEEFSFTLTPIHADGSPAGEALTVSCPAAQAGERAAFSFTLTYDITDYENAVYRSDDGDALFYWLLAESVPESANEAGYDEASHIQYDRGQYLVIVILHYDKAQHTLSAEKHYYPCTEDTFASL